MPELLPSILGMIENWGKWSEMGAVKSPDIITGSMTVEHILSITVLKWQVILVGCKIKVLNDLETRESKSSFVSLGLL